MTIQEILDRVSEYHPDLGEDYHGCDEVKFGDCSQECTGIVSALVPTVDVIRRTIELKANLLYVHEPVSYLTPDWPEWKADYKCRIYDEKLKLLKENKIVLVRDHDHMHAHKPDSIFTGVLKYLGWMEYLTEEQKTPFGYTVCFPKAKKLREINQELIEKIGMQGLRFIGNPEAELKKCYFYSGNGIKDTLVFRNGEIKYDGQDKLTFDASKQWSMFAAGTYTFTETQNAEIQITNTYSEQTADLDLIKTSVAGTKFDGAEFKLYKKNDEGAYELQKFEYTDKSGKNQTRETIQVINTKGSKAELKNLQSGQYYLEEVKAPEACMLLADKIYFKQEKGKITLTDKGGKVLADSPTMWTLSGTDGKYTLTVKNEILYSLPSAGGTGIYLYMIGGMLLMFAAVWILYKNKCKEVLKK